MTAAGQKAAAPPSHIVCCSCQAALLHGGGAVTVVLSDSAALLALHAQEKTCRECQWRLEKMSMNRFAVVDLDRPAVANDVSGKL